MKIELPKGYALFLLGSTGFNVFLAHIVMVSGAYNPFFLLALFSTFMLLVGHTVDDNKPRALRMGDHVAWQDTEGTVRLGVLMGKYNENWIVDWKESGMALGVLPEDKLTRVRK